VDRRSVGVPVTAGGSGAISTCTAQTGGEPYENPGKGTAGGTTGGPQLPLRTGPRQRVSVTRSCARVRARRPSSPAPPARLGHRRPQAIPPGASPHASVRRRPSVSRSRPMAPIDPSLFVKGVGDGGEGAWRGAVDGCRVAGVGSTAGPGVACAEAPVVRTLGRPRRLVESFPELPSRACQVGDLISPSRRTACRKLVPLGGGNRSMPRTWPSPSSRQSYRRSSPTWSPQLRPLSVSNNAEGWSRTQQIERVAPDRAQLRPSGAARQVPADDQSPHQGPIRGRAHRRRTAWQVGVVASSTGASRRPTGHTWANPPELSASPTVRHTRHGGMRWTECDGPTRHRRRS
jgi:hypothetical protein